MPEQAIIELLVNALIHRDYFTSASIRLLIFSDRIKIISPGHLPDSLSIEDIRLGATNRRNPTLTEHATHILPYRGMGSGIPRALDEWPNIRFESEMTGNQFKAVIFRQASAQVTPQVTLQVTPQVGVLLLGIEGEMTRQAIQDALGLADREHFRKPIWLRRWTWV